MTPEQLELLMLQIEQLQAGGTLLFGDNFNSFTYDDMYNFECALYKRIQEKRIDVSKFYGAEIDIMGLHQKPDVVKCLESILSRFPNLTRLSTTNSYQSVDSPIKNIFILFSKNRHRLKTRHSERLVNDIKKSLQELLAAKDKSIDPKTNIENYRLMLEKIKTINHYEFPEDVQIAGEHLIDFTKAIIEKTKSSPYTLPEFSKLLFDSTNGEGKNWTKPLTMVRLLLAYACAILGAEKANTAQLASSAFNRYAIANKIPGFDSELGPYLMPLLKRLTAIKKQFPEHTNNFLRRVEKIAGGLGCKDFRTQHNAFLVADDDHYSDIRTKIDARNRDSRSSASNASASVVAPMLLSAQSSSISAGAAGVVVNSSVGAGASSSVGTGASSSAVAGASSSAGAGAGSQAATSTASAAAKAVPMDLSGDTEALSPERQ